MVLAKREPPISTGMPTPRALSVIDKTLSKTARKRFFRTVNAANKLDLAKRKLNRMELDLVDTQSPANVEPRYYPVAAPSQPQSYRTEHTERNLSGLAAAASLAGPEAALAAGVVSGVAERASTIIGSTIQALQRPIVSYTETICKQGKRGYKTTTTSGSITTGMVLGGGLVLWIMSGGIDRAVNSYNHQYTPFEAKNLPAAVLGGPVGWILSAGADWTGHQKSHLDTDKSLDMDVNRWKWASWRLP